MAKPGLKFHSTGKPYSIVKQNDESTTLRVLVTTIGSADRKDLGGEWFHKDTNFGDDFVQTRFGTYGHGLNHERNPFADQKDLFLGPATLVEQDEAGRWFDFEIKRANQYHDFVLQLNTKGILGASSQCLPGSKSMDEDTGRIDTWMESEVAILVDPMDFKTIGQAIVIAKSLDLDAETLLKWNTAPGLTEEERKTERESILKEAGIDTAEGTEPDPAAEGEGGSESTLSDRIKAIFAANEEEDVSSEMEILKAVAGELTEMRTEQTNMKASMNLILDIWGQLETPLDGVQDVSVVELMSRLKSLPDLVQKQTQDTLEIKSAMTTFAEVVADKLQVQVAGAIKSRSEMSSLERALAEKQEEEVEHDSGSVKRIANYIPDNAPGGS